MLNLEKISRIVFAFMLSILQVNAQVLERFTMEAPALGTSVSIACFATDSAHAQLAMAKAFLLLDSFNTIFSDYDRQSEVMQVAAHYVKNSTTPVSKPLYDLTKKAQKIWGMTNGSFNVAIGALTHLWRSYLAQNEIPPQKKIRKFRKHLQAGRLQLIDGSNLKFGKKNMRMDFGGIAKGYIGDHMAKSLKEDHIDRFLIDLGGDLVAGEPPPGELAWKITISWCDKVVLIRNEAIATSGPDFQFFVHKGRRYAHIIDPKTGWGVLNFFGSTVIAKTGWEADGFASALSILSLGQSAFFLQRNTDIAAIIGRDSELIHSDNFSSYVLAEDQTKK
ncbi:MAG: FAD:protein FMN transferase [Saprospiraceae bacterium]|nr:FAD:protein FMN transferase [Saprospiraceae bacterium]